MNTTKTRTEIRDRRVILSALWMFVVFDYLYADLLTLIVNPASYQRAALGMSEAVVLSLAVLIEIPIAMVLLSRVLKYRANRWANILAGIESTAFVAVTLVGGKPPGLFYVLFSTVEIACTLFIIWYAWKWPDPEGLPETIAPNPGQLGGNS